MAEIGASSYRRFLLGDQKALQEFVCTYSDALVRFAYSYVRSGAAAEDVAAETIATFLLKKKSFPDEQRMRGYLYRMARSRCVDYLRHHQGEIPLEDVENVLGNGDPQQELMNRQRDEGLYVCMQRLPEQYRQVLQLAYFDGFSVKEICAILGTSAKQTYNLLARAKVSLKQFLEKEGITCEDL